MFGANCGNISTNEKICIFDILNVNNFMLKKFVFIVNLHSKNRIFSVSLFTFNAVIINITNLIYQLICKSIDSKGIPTKLESFFCGQNFPLLTYKNQK